MPQAPSLKERTAKGLFWGGISNGVQQLLNLLFGIVMSRLLTPADYGIVGMLAIFSLIAGSLQESGFVAALANKKHIEPADYTSVFWFSISVSALLYTLLYIASPSIARFYQIPELTPLARYVFVGFFIASTGIAHSAYLYRNLMVKQRAIATFVGLLISGTVGIVMAWKGFAYWGLATQSIVYVLVVNASYWYFVPWHPTFSFSWRRIATLLPFSIKLLITNLFNHINNNVITVLLGKFYTRAEVGYFSQANKWNTMGHSLSTSTINSVAQPILATLTLDHERNLRAFRKMLRVTSILSFPLMLGLMIIARELIVITITEKWIASAELLSILCMGGAFIPINNLFGQLVISQGKSGTYMGSTVTLGIIQLALMLLLYPYGIRAMVCMYVALNSCWLFVWYYFAHATIGLKFTHLLRDVFPFAVIAVASMALTWLLTSGIENIVWRLLSKIAIAACLYIGLLWLSGSKTFREMCAFAFTHLHLKR